MLSSSITKRLDNGDADWQALKHHIEENIDSLNRMDDIDFSDKERSAIICLGRQEAVRVLKEILEPFGAAEELTDVDSEHLAKKTGVL